MKRNKQNARFNEEIVCIENWTRRSYKDGSVSEVLPVTCEVLSLEPPNPPCMQSSASVVSEEMETEKSSALVDQPGVHRRKLETLSSVSRQMIRTDIRGRF